MSSIMKILPFVIFTCGIALGGYYAFQGYADNLSDSAASYYWGLGGLVAGGGGMLAYILSRISRRR